jgi:hypothetical protein
LRSSTARRCRRAFALALVAGALLTARTGRAQTELPPDRQAVILVRSLAYDNNLKARAGDAVVVAVLFRPGNAASESAGEAMARAFRGLENVKIQELPFRAVALAYPGKGGLKSAVQSQGIDALYVCAGLEGDLGGIREFSRREHVLTMGARDEFVQSGLSLGVFSVDGKPTITVNLPASREEGAAFGSELLRLARVVR